MVLRQREVQRQRVGDGLGVRLGQALDRGAGAAVQLLPAPVGQTPVGRVAEHAVTEPQPVVAVRQQVVRQLLAGPLVQDEVLTGQHLGQDRGPEAAAEHRRVAQQPPGQRRQRVDLGPHHRTERVGQLVHAACVPGRAQQLLEVQRAPCGPLDHRLDLVGPQRGRLGRRHHQPPALVVRERPQLDGRPARHHEAARAGPAGHAQQPRVVGHHGHEAVEQLRGGLVDPLPVLHHHERGPVESRDQELHGGGMEALAPEAGLERRRGLGVGHVEAGHGPEQRQHRHELRGEPGHAGPQLTGHGCRLAPLDPEQRAHRIAQGPVGGRDTVRLAPHLQPCPTGGCGPDLVDQARLADARLAHDGHHAAGALGRSVPSFEQRDPFGAPAAERQQAGPSGRAGAGLAPHPVGVDRGRLALHRERLQRRHLEHRAGPVQHARGRVGRAGWRRRHEPRREVHRVTHDGERAAVLGPDVAGEDVTTVHADAHRQRRAGVEHLPHGAQQPALVVVLGPGHPGGQDHLEAVAVEVGGQERDPLAIGRRLDDAHGRVERRRDRLGAPLGEQRVRPLEPQEPDRGDAVLGLHQAGRQVRPQRARQPPGRRLGARGPQEHGPARRDRRAAPAQQPALALGGADRSRGQRGGGRRADDDLALLGGLLHERRRRRGRAGDDQLLVRVADQEQVGGAGVHPDRHAQVEPARRRRPAGCPAQRGTHLHRRGAGLNGVVPAVEVQQQGVAPELQQSAAPVVGDVQHGAEDRAQHVRQLLGPDPAPPRQPLRQLREAGDVDEHERGLDRSERLARRVQIPLERHPRDVPLQAIAVDHVPPRRDRAAGRSAPRSQQVRAERDGAAGQGVRGLPGHEVAAVAQQERADVVGNTIAAMRSKSG